MSAPPYHQLNIAFHTGDDPEIVARNRQRLFELAGIDRALFMDQIHSTKIEYVDHFCHPQCDGVITDRPDLPLAVMSADCYGVLLFDRKRGIIGALHAGRAGALGGIVQKALELMVSDFGAEEIEGVISPGIGSCCYQVGEEILQRVDSRYVERERFLNIKRAIVDQLNLFGVDFVDYGICTSCDPNYYSYRRDGLTGRFASIIWRSS
ncbi:MAG: peptidoglycan editing factor PgeF [Epsilonproteobacteria bacterium]|nr:peptidoglycan editing factor PgeF [Campylobacterota bacterium]